MGLDYKLDKTDKKIQEKIREHGGVANIDSPLREIVIPLAKERMYEDTDERVRRMRKDHRSDKHPDWLDRLPQKMPERKTIQNIAQRIEFEEHIKAGAREYQAFTGEKLGYKLEELQLDNSRGDK